MEVPPGRVGCLPFLSHSSIVTLFVDRAFGGMVSLGLPAQNVYTSSINDWVKLMDLSLHLAVADGLKSQSQIARRITEDWASRNLYCLGCPSEKLVADRPSTPVQDFTCPLCKTTYQLKSKNGRHGKVIANSAYFPKVTAIRQGKAPNYAFLGYNRKELLVTSLFVVPGHFLTESVVQKRSPLRPNARRAGWVGSNILLWKLPPEGRIAVVSDGSPIEPEVVRHNWNKYEFLKDDPRASGGWGPEILAAVRDLQAETQSNEFTLQTFYTRFMEAFVAQHPNNHNVDARIRRQLQLLRDNDILQFLGRGRYRIIG